MSKPDIKVGPRGDGTYGYMVNGILSANKYDNRASALHDAKRLQLVIPASQSESK